MVPAILETERLILRPFELSDAPDVQRLAGHREVALNTLTIPHPYPDGAAEEWIRKHLEDADLQNFAIIRRSDHALVGTIGLVLKKDHDKGEIGYWIGVPYWNHGYATEAAAVLIDYGFKIFGLEKIFAAHFSRNAASGRVMLKNGMKHEGTLRHDIKKWDQYVDVEMYSILREEWEVKRRERLPGC
jgi:RimJ/RimL family protein N-acetyltransferase